LFHFSTQKLNDQSGKLLQIYKTLTFVSFLKTERCRKKDFERRGRGRHETRGRHEEHDRRLRHPPRGLPVPLEEVRLQKQKVEGRPSGTRRR